ncbi:hypothetical protein EMPS_01441 [Entomortierella parvispora]|uniref:Glutathione S-transferase 3, mitochondrial n=1 Tax=Entomortierella parvispora TaxID=205924 RepID=A0A9P3H312_9FUNG|nr:hypothetical protein EMPS_01441 [Entomortierella parvispora]
MSTIVLSPEYGYTVAVAVASTVLVSFFGYRVARVRALAKVPLPFMYADAAEVKEDYQKHIFNCYQRIHQNTLEGFSSYLVTLMFAGLQYPIPSAVLGGIWILGRIFYYRGYSTGNPEDRSKGAFGRIGDLGLLGLTGKMAFDLITSGI